MKHNRIPLGIFFTLLVLLAHTAAQTPQPHVQALREQLKLSSNLQLKWQPNASGLDTLHVVDDFNRASLGPDWLLDERFWAIENFELVLNDTSPSEWRYLALFKPVFNTLNRKIHSVTYRWGQQADSVGIGEGSFALLINKRSFKGDAYWLWRRTNQTSVWLYAIKNGAWEYTPGESKEYHRADSHTPIPKAGDVITATMRNEVHSIFFDYYINGRWDATVQDTSKEFARQDTSYFGLFMHGQNLNNMIDDFTLTWLVPDTVAPAALNDLRATDSSLTSITLAWTMTGDNYWDGQARVLDLRYATFPLNAANFSLATPALNIPAPAASGAAQQFTINNLQSNTRYYFAGRVLDEANNARGISNVAQSTTPTARVATALQLIDGCDQIGRVGATLSRPLTVSVQDQFGAAFAGYAVRFAVQSGEASFANGASELLLNTDNNGLAASEVRLGTIPGAIAIEITAANLSGSPILCNATAASGAPAELIHVSGDFQFLSAGVKAAPIVVRATDQFGNSAADFPTQFEITKGASVFLNGASSFSTQTAANGTASAELFASTIAGDTTNVTVTLTDSLFNTQLQTRFLIFSAAADSLLALGGDQQIDTVGTQLEESLRVRVRDVLGAPVRNFSLLFKIAKGAGTLGNGEATQTIATDSNGVAATTWTLGATPGANEITVEANGLKGSPLTFRATGLGVSAVHERASELPKEFALLQNSPNPFSANGTFGNPETTIYFALPDASNITLTLYDVNGRVVRVLLDATLQAGEHRARWNGRDENDHASHTGVYFYRLHARGKTSGKIFQATRKLVLAK